MVDVIGGEVNSRTMSKIVCRFRGETLGDMYIRLFRKKYAKDNDWELKPDRPRGFIDTTPWLKPETKPDAKSETKPETKSESKFESKFDVKPDAVKKGGNQTFRRYPSCKKNTRRRM